MVVGKVHLPSTLKISLAEADGPTHVYRLRFSRKVRTFKAVFEGQLPGRIVTFPKPLAFGNGRLLEAYNLFSKSQLNLLKAVFEGKEAPSCLWSKISRQNTAPSILKGFKEFV